MSQAKPTHPLPTDAQEAELRAWCEDRGIRLQICKYSWLIRRGALLIMWRPSDGKLRYQDTHVGTFSYAELRTTLPQYFPLQQEPPVYPTVPPIEDQLRELAKEEWAQLDRQQLVDTLRAAIKAACRVIDDHRKLNRTVDNLRALVVIAHRVIHDLDCMTETNKESKS